jgi:hypothetical protein
MFVEMFKSTHPGEIKVVSRKVEPDKITFDLLPGKIPPAMADMAKSANFKMTGVVCVVKEDGQWKIHKDVWSAEASGKDGSQRMTIGTDPDKEDAEKPSSLPAEKPANDSAFNDYPSSLRDFLMKKWQQAGTGKKIYVTMKILPNGNVADLKVAGEKQQKEAEEQLRKLITSAQPLPALPSDKQSTPFVWMMFDWQDKGRCISGPYFEDKNPDWVFKQSGAKTSI